MTISGLYIHTYINMYVSTGYTLSIVSASYMPSLSAEYTIEVKLCGERWRMGSISCDVWRTVVKGLTRGVWVDDHPNKRTI